MLFCFVPLSVERVYVGQWSMVTRARLGQVSEEVIKDAAPLIGTPSGGPFPLVRYRAEDARTIILGLRFFCWTPNNMVDFYHCHPASSFSFHSLIRQH